MTLTMRTVGTRPLLMHNARLANPLDPYTRQLKAITGKRRKTDDDLIAIMQIEARGGAYETPEGLIGLPTAMAWRTIETAARTYKRGTDIKRALIYTDDVQPLVLDGKNVTVDEFLADPDNIDYRVVVVQRNRTMRARPIIAEGWECTFAFELLDDVMDARDLGPIVEHAGRLVGFGNWRPTYGTFTATLS